MGVSVHWGSPIAGWFMMENPDLKWMMTGGPPMTARTFYNTNTYFHNTMRTPIMLLTKYKQYILLTIR